MDCLTHAAPRAQSQFSLRLHRIPWEFHEFSMFREIPEYSRFVATRLMVRFCATLQPSQEVLWSRRNAVLRPGLVVRSYSQRVDGVDRHTARRSVARWPQLATCDKVRLNETSRFVAERHATSPCCRHQLQQPHIHRIIHLPTINLSRLESPQWRSHRPL